LPRTAGAALPSADTPQRRTILRLARHALAGKGIGRCGRPVRLRHTSETPRRPTPDKGRRCADRTRLLGFRHRRLQGIDRFATPLSVPRCQMATLAAAPNRFWTNVRHKKCQALSLAYARLLHEHRSVPAGLAPPPPAASIIFGGRKGYWHAPTACDQLMVSRRRRTHGNPTGSHHRAYVRAEDAGNRERHWRAESDAYPLRRCSGEVRDARGSPTAIRYAPSCASPCVTRRVAQSSPYGLAPDAAAASRTIDSPHTPSPLASAADGNHRLRMVGAAARQRLAPVTRRRPHKHRRYSQSTVGSEKTFLWPPAVSGESRTTATNRTAKRGG
jgi:hypothetical protein